MRAVKEVTEATGGGGVQPSSGPMGPVGGWPGRTRQFLHDVRLEMRNVTWRAWPTGTGRHRGCRGGDVFLRVLPGDGAGRAPGVGDGLVLEIRQGVAALVEQATKQKQWYIIHTYSGFERKVAESLRSRVEAFGLQERIGEAKVPN